MPDVSALGSTAMASISNHFLGAARPRRMTGRMRVGGDVLSFTGEAQFRRGLDVEIGLGRSRAPTRARASSMRDCPRQRVRRGQGGSGKSGCRSIGPDKFGVTVGAAGGGAGGGRHRGKPKSSGLSVGDLLNLYRSGPHAEGTPFSSRS